MWILWGRKLPSPTDKASRRKHGADATAQPRDACVQDTECQTVENLHRLCDKLQDSLSKKTRKDRIRNSRQRLISIEVLEEVPASCINDLGLKSSRPADKLIRLVHNRSV